jgi:rubrerythrin
VLSEDAKNAAKVMDAMAELELVISELYECAGERWEENREFWSGLAVAERSHADYLRRMAGILNGRPLEFEMGRPLATATVNTVMSGVKNLIQRLKNGEFNQKALLFLARDIEQSILESKYSEILKTKDVEYQKLVTEIVSQTEAHRQLLIRKIGEVK